MNSFNYTSACNISESELQASKDYIDSLDFSYIIERLVNSEGWLIEDAEKTCQQYRNFLFINRKYGKFYRALPPSEDIDEFWHAHILHTKYYTHDSQQIFGHYFHHLPEMDRLQSDHVITSKINRAFENTQDLYFKEFGEYITPTRSKYPNWIYFIFKKLY